MVGAMLGGARAAIDLGEQLALDDNVDLYLSATSFARRPSASKTRTAPRTLQWLMFPRSQTLDAGRRSPYPEPQQLRRSALRSIPICSELARACEHF